MSYLGVWQIDDVMAFSCATHSATTGGATDADMVPTYRVYEDDGDTAMLTGAMSAREDAYNTGVYKASLTLSAANGFENGKQYTIQIRAIVGAVTGETHHTFQVEAAYATAAALAVVDDFVDDLETRLTEARAGYLDNLSAGAVAQQSALVNGSGDITPPTNKGIWDALGTGARAISDLPIASEVNAEIDTALNTAIPGSPTTNSINQRVVAIDDLTQASGAGDLASALTNILAIFGAGAWDLSTLGDRVGQLGTIATVVSATTTTIRIAAGSASNIYKGRPVVVVAGGAATKCASVVTGDTLNVPYQDLTISPAMAVAPSPSDTIMFLSTFMGNPVPTAADNADALFDEAVGGHTSDGTFGEVVNDMIEDNAGTYRYTTAALANGPGGTAPTVQEIVDGVYNEPVASHTTALSFGKIWNDILETSVGLYRFTAAALANAGGSASAVADAVWDEAFADHAAAGSFGKIVKWVFLRLCGKRTITRAAASVETVYDTDDTSEFVITGTETTSLRTYTPDDQTP